MNVMQQANIIDGRAMAAEVRCHTAERIAHLKSLGRNVRLDALLVGHDGAATIYARNQGKMCGEVGIEYVLHELAADATEDDIAQLVGFPLSDRHEEPRSVRAPSHPAAPP